MPGINKSTWRSQELLLKAGQVKQVLFMDTKPNFIQVKNISQNNVFLGLTPRTNVNYFDLSIIPGATRNYVNPQGVKELYFYADVDTTIYINSAEGDISAADFDQTQISVLQTNNVTPAVDVANFIELNTLQIMLDIKQLLSDIKDQSVANNTLVQDIKTQEAANNLLLQDIKTNTTPAV
jgi:hypothetical protein